MSIEFSIHKATADDIEDMLRLNQDLFEYEFNSDFSKTYNQEWTKSETGRNVFLKYCTDPKKAAWVANNSEGEAVGYIACIFESLDFRNPKELVEIEMIYLDENYRCSGIGRTLIGKVKEWSAEMGAGIIRVGALAPNKHARDFYEKWGFAEAEIMFELICGENHN